MCQILSTRCYQNTEVGQLTECRGEKAPQVGDAWTMSLKDSLGRRRKMACKTEDGHTWKQAKHASYCTFTVTELKMPGSW